MTVETFFANFGHLADAPNGVQKLRELILQLAVQGKLVPQDANDEPASVLLERIEVEKARLVKEKIIRKAKLTPIAPEEKIYELPSCWVWVRFGSIAQHNAGKTLDKGRNTGQLRDYITTSNLYWGYFDLNNVRQMPIKEEELERCTAKQGDLLIVEGGEAGRAAVWTKDHEVCFQNHVHRARFYCDVDPFYIYRFFEKLNLSGEISQYRKGVGISNMSGKSLSSIVLPLPPLKEQKRIVAKVDQLMTLCDELEARQQKQQQVRVRLNNATLDGLLTAREPDEFADHWQRICTNFDLLYDHPETITKLRAAILQLAVRGKLVPQDPNDEPASVLLERIRAEKERLVKEKVIRKNKQSQAGAETEYEAQIRMGWMLCRLSDVAITLITGPFGSSLHKSDYVQGGIPVINPASLKDERITPLPNMAINQSTLERLSGFVLEHNDIVMARRGEMGRCALVNKNETGWLCGTGSVILRISSEVYHPYFVKLIGSDSVREYLSSSSVGSTMSNLNQKILMNMVVLLPPKEEQKRIVAKVDQLMALCDVLESRLNQAQKQSGKLMEATVRQLLVA